MKRAKLTLVVYYLCAAMSAWAALIETPTAACSPCTGPDNGFNSSDFPGPCPYIPCCPLMIVDGLPPGSPIQVTSGLSNYVLISRTPGGVLGGEIVVFSAQLQMTMQGTGTLSGFSRNISLPVTVRVDNAPKIGAGTIIQRYAGDLQQLQGQLVGDPDFDLLRITAGTAFGLPSPGHTSISKRIPPGDWSFDSFFDITYRIDFIGAGGGPFVGMSGSTNGGPVRFSQGCPRWNPGDSTKMHYAQEPENGGWDVYTRADTTNPLADDFKCTETGPIKDVHFWGSWRGGAKSNIDNFTIEFYSDIPAGVDLPYSHPGSLLWTRTFDGYVMTPFSMATPGGWYDPSAGGGGLILPNNHAEYWQYDILIGSPWFNQQQDSIYWMRIIPRYSSPSFQWGWHTSGSPHFNDDAVYRQQLGSACLAPDAGGTAIMPAICPFDHNDSMYILDGLTPAGSIAIEPTIQLIGGVVEGPGGPLGGTQSTFSAQLKMVMNGTGAFSAYSRTIAINLPSNQMYTSPRTPFTTPQQFNTIMNQMQGQITVDPDFDLLRVTAGTGFGLPSPGKTKLMQSGTSWDVSSFFDITYRIDFVGAAGGPFAGRSGSTTGTARFRQGITDLPTWINLHVPPTFSNSMDLSFVITKTNTTCCLGALSGNVDCDPSDAIDISDLTSMIDNLYISFAPLCCTAEANTDGDPGMGIDISDLSRLIDYLYISFTPVAPCM